MHGLCSERVKTHTFRARPTNYQDAIEAAMCESALLHSENLHTTNKDRRYIMPAITTVADEKSNLLGTATLGAISKGNRRPFLARNNTRGHKGGARGKYCSHHKVNTHNTLDCRALKSMKKKMYQSKPRRRSESRGPGRRNTQYNRTSSRSNFRGRNTSRRQSFKSGSMNAMIPYSQSDDEGETHQGHQTTITDEGPFIDDEEWIEGTHTMNTRSAPAGLYMISKAIPKEIISHRKTYDTTAEKNETSPRTLIRHNSKNEAKNAIVEELRKICMGTDECAVTLYSDEITIKIDSSQVKEHQFLIDLLLSNSYTWNYSAQPHSTPLIAIEEILEHFSNHAHNHITGTVINRTYNNTKHDKQNFHQLAPIDETDAATTVRPMVDHTRSVPSHDVMSANATYLFKVVLHFEELETHPTLNTLNAEMEIRGESLDNFLTYMTIKFLDTNTVGNPWALAEGINFEIQQRTSERNYTDNAVTFNYHYSFSQLADLYYTHNRAVRATHHGISINDSYKELGKILEHIAKCPPCRTVLQQLSDSYESRPHSTVQKLVMTDPTTIINLTGMNGHTHEQGHQQRRTDGLAGDGSTNHHLLRDEVPVADGHDIQPHTCNDSQGGMPQATMQTGLQHNPHTVDGAGISIDTGDDRIPRRDHRSVLIASNQDDWEKYSTEFQVWLLKYRNQITDIGERHRRCTQLYEDYAIAAATQRRGDANRAIQDFHNEVLSYMTAYPSHDGTDPHVPARWLQEANTLWNLQSQADEEGRRAFWTSEPYIWFHTNDVVQCKPLTHYYEYGPGTPAELENDDLAKAYFRRRMLMGGPRVRMQHSPQRDGPRGQTDDQQTFMHTNTNREVGAVGPQASTSNEPENEEGLIEHRGTMAKTTEDIDLNTLWHEHSQGRTGVQLSPSAQIAPCYLIEGHPEDDYVGDCMEQDETYDVIRPVNVQPKQNGLFMMQTHSAKEIEVTDATMTPTPEVPEAERQELSTWDLQAKTLLFIRELWNLCELYVGQEELIMHRPIPIFMPKQTEEYEGVHKATKTAFTILPTTYAEIATAFKKQEQLSQENTTYKQHNAKLRKDNNRLTRLRRTLRRKLEKVTGQCIDTRLQVERMKEEKHHSNRKPARAADRSRSPIIRHSAHNHPTPVPARGQRVMTTTDNCGAIDLTMAKTQMDNKCTPNDGTPSCDGIYSLSDDEFMIARKELEREMARADKRGENEKRKQDIIKILENYGNHTKTTVSRKPFLGLTTKQIDKR